MQNDKQIYGDTMKKIIKLAQYLCGLWRFANAY